MINSRRLLRLIRNVTCKISLPHVACFLKLRNTVKETIELQKAAETQRDQAEATMLEVLIKYYEYIN